MGKTLYEKVFDLHTVRELAAGQYQLFIGLHLIHEATSPQAFAMLRERGLSVAYPERTFATADHVIPTDSVARPYKDGLSEAMVEALDQNTQHFGVRYFSPARGEHGIVHVIGPEYGLSQPGLTIACGDSHTSTHGAFGSIAFGIGTSQVRDVLATQTLAMSKLKVRRIEINGHLMPGVYAKDVALFVINRLGVQGGVGYAYEFAGDVVDAMSMEERMTLCNMSIEGGARCGYVNPDQKTYDYLEGREFTPKGEAWTKALTYWKSIASDQDAAYDDVVVYRGEEIEPMVTWGINPGQSISVGQAIPALEGLTADEAGSAKEAIEFMGMASGTPIAGTRIDVAFIGSCTNGRMSDFVTAAAVIKGRKVAPHVRALVVPGSQKVRDEMIAQGLDKVFIEAGFDFREAGCSMCLAMNPDKLNDREICASSSNRNFKGRQGSPVGRTLLMSPAMVAAAAINGAVIDARQFDLAS
ncbi:3-isopropylmalate/(R)-2-methylmalate dehydratase large subunit [Rhodoligotrophos appendicifer]|uniref:3-isopropylmalate dehydratase large subunit n=1 Tax=Rhodoligotrophos appendicifer TaxID=987056 RepID=UPI001185FF1A|nr:3-isopropylmalate dehydratase large subunit [Rhodoligotrophos appendicifer]